MGSGENTIDKKASASQRRIYIVQISSGNNVSAESGAWDISQHHPHSQMSSDPRSRNITIHVTTQIKMNMSCAIVLGLIDAR